MDIQRIRGDLENLIGADILVNEPMSKHTTWKIGGPADLLIVPDTVEDLIAVVQFSRDQKIPFYVIGNGSNVLVRDKGVRGLVIKTSGLNQITCKGDLLTAGAGAMVPVLARKAAEMGLGGLEFAVGIPASVGGAVFMNAGAHGSCMANVVEEVNVLCPAGEQVSLTGSEIGFRYRSTSLRERNYIITHVVFKLAITSAEEIAQRMSTLLEIRNRSQPKGRPNAGSVFKNPSGQAAGKIIDEAGCKGIICGGAQVSQKHANFILNCNNATAYDILQLIEIIREKVYEKFQINLELEIQVIGE